MSAPEPQYLPAEWAEQSGIMLTWPHAQGDWGNTLEAVEDVFIQIAQAVSRFEKLLIICLDEEHQRHIRQHLESANISADKVSYYIAPSNDVWVRDHGPLTVIKNGAPHLMDFTFNGWGAKYPASLDNAVTRTLHAAGAFGNASLESNRLVFEGGSIDVDGEGTLLTTSNCLLSPMRNPHVDCDLIETMLGEIFNTKRFLWLEYGCLVGDDTDGHVDTLARFTDPRTIAYITCDDPADENYPALKKMQQELREFRTISGDPYKLVPLPSPSPKHDQKGNRLPATYANFLIINHAVLVPTYDDPADSVALEHLQGCFPDREIIAIPCTPLVSQYGSLHCATMQLPAGVL